MINLYIFSQINNLALQWRWLDALAIFLAKDVIWLLFGVLFLFLLRDYKFYSQMFLGAFLSAFLGGGLSFIIKSIFYNPRPFVLRNVNLLIGHDLGSSFPSSHTTILFALSFFIFLYAKKSSRFSDKKIMVNIGCIFLGISFLVGLARVFVGVHWPMDILGGILLGILSAWFANEALEKFIYKKLEIKNQRTAL